MSAKLLSAEVSFEENHLINQRFGDIYFSQEDGLEESQQVFIEGNSLAERLKGRAHFTIAETGFGTGLNFLAILSLIEKMGDNAPNLTYIATEIAPLNGEIIAKALANFPSLSTHLKALTEALPLRIAGQHRRLFLNGKVALCLLYGDSYQSLKAADFKADAWYLDGFAPNRNPDMWDEKLLAMIAERSAADATLASFTAATHVRKKLEKVGFEITRHQGFGKKRERISGHFKKKLEIASSSGGKKITIIGAGIAGASVAHALNRLGYSPLVLSADQLGEGASGNIVGLQVPWLTATEQVETRLSLTAWSYAYYLAKALNAGIDEGCILYAHNEKKRIQTEKIVELPLYRGLDSVFREVSSDEATELSGINLGYGGLYLPQGLTIDPKDFVKKLLGDCEIQFGIEVKKITPNRGGYRLDYEGGHIDSDIVIVASGVGLEALNLPQIDMPLQITAGAVTHITNPKLTPKIGMSFGGYLAKASDGVVALGASFDHYKLGTPLPAIDKSLRERNLALLPEIARKIFASESNFDARISLRLAASDRQPFAGKLDDNLYILGALGARGMVTAPLLGEYIASLITATPSPLLAGMAEIVSPRRFAS